MRATSLRIRLTVLLALAVFVALGAAAKIVDWRADSDMQQRFDTSLLVRARALAALTVFEDGRVVVGPDRPAVGVFPGDTDVSRYALSCEGAVVARTAEVPPPMAAGSEPTFANARLNGGRIWRVVALRFRPEVDNAASTDPPACTLRYALDRGPLDEILHMLDFTLVGSLLGACVAVMLATPWLVRRGLRPLEGLDHAMAGIGPDAPGGRLPVTGTAELVPLVARFNEVLARMDAGLARERQFASGLAHEFRTRLAELRALVDVEQRYPSGRDAHSLLGEVGSIGVELEATVTALLQLTRIQSGLEASSSETVKLAPMLARVHARHREVAESHAVRIESAPCDPVLVIETDPVLLEIVLDNLLGNAVAYAPGGSTVTLHATPGGVDVRNAAPTLQVADLVHFGRRFWRKDMRGAGHAGLGLALAGAAARALHMTLSFTLDGGVLRASVSWRGA
ncbi:MAG: sensor histidine kinase N-terminal domain-containing protein [Rhodanobacteraceae bacterium]